jgi:hypothetical protein
MSTRTKYERLLARRAPQDERRIYNFSESFETQYGEATKYLIGAMSPVAPRYTQRLVEQGDRVENQLKTRLAELYPALEFRRQGSVSNNTHIKFRSDVDVLVIIDKFHTLEPPQQPPSPYRGNPDQDLIDLRQNCADELKNAFPAATVDNKGSTCVTIDGGSLVCAVDAVPSNWFNTVAWSQYRQEHERGVQVYNRDKRQRILNRPFLYNHRIHLHDAPRIGVPRCLMRLLKNIKADHEKSGLDDDVDFSSFDICSLVYRMPDDLVTGIHNRPLHLIYALLVWMANVLNTPSLRGSLNVVDDSRLIFDTPTKERGLRILFEDLNILYHQADQETSNRQILTESHL